ncbi:hypothetical protein FC83_GL001449 [Agrilactobacillus composti DSM 18527 = JCM 14202]|uniref:Uncharacterized protein n=1 Tax=Agrilactobacillus composti DSM 18527 = JCM 14202 TaxID=1423734 RepID=X0PSD4_9LACO|nr:hypothetical protein [Agrilactobacillus composti]KRM30888.1 hypothetical protein FC83_GL001449 [Agrilactobacillus composti DSM 18527 = JCM 14202]GAF40822.1 hypothetical protein JCM14202_2730 [Agrilactobacillus composti DSM 18527 = JCM 14202]
MNLLSLLLICVGIIVITSFCLMYYMYHLVLIDATSRNITHPKFWSVLSSANQNGGGLLIYLFKHRNTASLLKPVDQQKIASIKNKIYCLLAVDLAVFLILIALLCRSV